MYQDDLRVLYTYKSEESADVVFATPRSWAAVSDLLEAGLDADVLRIKTEANIGESEAAGFFAYTKNSRLLPDIEAVLRGAYLTGNDNTPFRATIDVYWLLVQNLIHAISVEYRKNGEDWRLFANNSIDFICSIDSFPIELKKSYVDQLCEMDKEMRAYVYNDAQNRNLSKLLQELNYIKA